MRIFKASPMRVTLFGPPDPYVHEYAVVTYQLVLDNPAVRKMARPNDYVFYNYVKHDFDVCPADEFNKTYFPCRKCTFRGEPDGQEIDRKDRAARGDMA